ncbi:MAG: hypothetical protein RLY18_1445 [Pseudomonadota bacterium]|jgi:hypothetical protein
MIVDSKQQMLQVNELLQAAAENTQSEYPVEMVYAAFAREAQMPNSKFLRYGNTIFIIHGDLEKPGVGSFRALNADTAQNFLQSSYQFVIDAYKAGYYLLVTKFRDQNLLNIFKIIQRSPPNPGMGFDVKTGADGQYVVNLMVGDPNQIELAKPIGRENMDRTMSAIRDATAQKAMAAMQSGDLGEAESDIGEDLDMAAQPPMPQRAPQMTGALQGLRKPSPMEGEV